MAQSRFDVAPVPIRVFVYLCSISCDHRKLPAGNKSNDHLIELAFCLLRANRAAIIDIRPDILLLQTIDTALCRPLPHSICCTSTLYVRRVNMANPTHQRNEKKKIAFVMESMVIGGTEKALSELINVIDPQKYDIYLFVRDDSGAFSDLLAPNVKIHLWNCDPAYALKGQLRKLHVFDLFRSLFHRLLVRVHQKNWRKCWFYSTLCYPVYTDEVFDCVIAYQINSPAVLASALHKIRGRKKCAFYHGRSAIPPQHTSFWDKIYSMFDQIFCVSNSARSEFCETYPTAGKKTSVLYNLLNSKTILSMATEPAPAPISTDRLSILTVGRLSTEKGQTMIPKAAQLLIDAGHDFCWYLIGDGDTRKEIEAEIEKYHVDDSVILLGAISNPYPYIKSCDIYVQTSLSEGWGLTVQEARILAKPIVVTPLPVMREQIIDRKTGIIAQDLSAEGLFDAIRHLIDDPGLCAAFTRELGSTPQDNSSEVDKLLRFID